MAVAAILKKNESDHSLLDKKIHINKSDMVNYNPITQKHIGSSMTVAELSAAALQYSDNAAMNKLLAYLGGPQQATHFARTIGDKAFRIWYCCIEFWFLSVQAKSLIADCSGKMRSLLRATQIRK